MKILTSLTPVIMGFSLVLILQSVLIAVSIFSVQDNSKRLLNVVQEQKDMQQIFIMREANLDRSILLFHAAVNEDLFIRQELYEQFMAKAINFIKARDIFLEQAKARQSWEKFKPLIRKSTTVQHAAIEQMLEGKTIQGLAILLKEVIPAQDAVKTNLTAMLNEQRHEIENDLAVTTQKNALAFFLISLIGGSSLVLGAAIAAWVIRHTRRTQRLEQAHTTRIRSLYDISAKRGSLDQQINAMLQFGCHELKMEIGKVCQIDAEQNTNTALYAVSPPPIKIILGHSIPLDSSFCMHVHKNFESLTIEHAAESAFKNTAAYQETHIESYIGVPITVQGSNLGTLCFANRQPRQKFTTTDTDLIKLMGNWVSVNLEKQFANKELSIAKENAEKSNLAKSAFLANMSHEIRTPLTAIIGFSEALLGPDLTFDEYRMATDSILRNGKHLLQTINNILDISKIEAGQLGLEIIKTCPLQVMAEIESIIGVRARDKGFQFNIEYELPIPKYIHTDPIRLKQILINLVGNAIKFTHAGGISIHLSCDLTDEVLCFKVKDTGIGMSTEERENIFEPFAQADNTMTRRYGGTGLGLSISMQLAQMLGGTLQCDSSKDHGSTFILTVATGSLKDAAFVTNIDQEMLDMPRHDVTQAKPLQGKILLAEDNKHNQQLISLHLRKFGLDVKVVSDGEQATREALKTHFDLVLMDMQMPVMDGIKAITQLRKSGYTTPIISLTANAMKSDWETCIAAGANEYLTKPIDIERFYSILQAYLPLAENRQTDASAPKAIAQQAELDDDADYQALIDSFLEKLPNMVSEITAAIPNNWQAAGFIAHQLKGIGGGFGYAEITQVAGAIDHSIQSQQYAQAEREIQKLQLVCEKVTRGRPIILS